MRTLSVQEATAAVRKNLDEIGLNESVMYDTENTDNVSLDETIARTLPEAVNAMHLAAPVDRIEWDDYAGPFDSVAVSERVLTFSLTADVLRLVRFQAADSPIVVTDELAEASPEGRKQLNKYIRGTFDRPRLVRLQGSRSKPAYAYYSLRSDSYANAPASAIKQFAFIPVQTYGSDKTGYEVSAGLLQNVTDTLTAMVLSIYGNGDRAGYFFDKAKIL